MCDPPWRYKDNSCQGAAEKHYPTLKLEDICNLPVEAITDKDCILFLWATYPMLNEALAVIKAWGFTYKTIAFQWLKYYENGKFVLGLGRWTRGNSECCLLATKGKPKRIGTSVSQIICSGLLPHSQKPHVAREKIVELMGDLPRIELFARQTIPGWDSIGNEIDGKDIRDALKEVIEQ